MEVQPNDVDNIVDRWRGDRSYLIEMLQDVQEQFHYIPKEVAEKLSSDLDVPLTHIFHITTFYKGFTLEPRGKYPISVCTGTACHVKGGARILENVMRELNVSREGEATPDGLFSVESVRCLGCCGLAPVVTVGDDVYGRTSSTKVNRLIKRIKGKER
ncbi:MAG: NAD(P)H-dependent oxidoreductase subunit E [Deltaproteobacteria bacterium]|nr:NAD(P)H-dependent oxidoreductase subunit E [Deltaproteobacteria bacterium]